MSELRGHTALVTGASSGIGAAIARQLAARGCGLILTARRCERLEALAGELAAAHGVSARTVGEDLCDPAAPARLHQAVRAEGSPIDILVNNAGIAIFQGFGDTPWPRQADLVQLLVTAPVELTARFLPDLTARGRRTHILNVSSTAAFVHVPYMAVYNGSKSFVLAFSRSLAAELAATSVAVTCLVPGGTATEFPDVAGQALSGSVKASLMSADRCARIAVRGMLRGRRVVVPGATNKGIWLASRLLPQRLLAAAGGRLIGRPVARTAELETGGSEKRG